MARVKISGIPGREGPVSGILVKPSTATALLVLAHGAGAGMDHSFMNELAASLGEENIATLRYQFPYSEDGKKRPDSPKLATATVASAVRWAIAHEPDLPLFAGGKSFGSRMSTTAAAMGLVPGVKGIICYGFPLHQANEPAIERAAHLKDVKVPLLFLQGTRDTLASLSLMRQVAGNLPLAKMHVVDGADHSFAVLKSSGRTNADVIKELARKTRDFCQKTIVDPNS